MTTGRARDKFPLTKHPTGQHCKKHKGRTYYLGSDRDDAMRRFATEWDDIKAGRAPRRRTDSISVADLCNHFLTAKRERVRSGEMTPRH
jgi:hypothetical protein